MIKKCSNCNRYISNPLLDCKYYNIKRIEKIEYNNDCPF